MLRVAVDATVIAAASIDLTYHKRMSTNETLIRDIILGITETVCLSTFRTQEDIIRNNIQTKQLNERFLNSKHPLKPYTVKLKGIHERFEFKSWAPFMFAKIRRELCDNSDEVFLKSWLENGNLSLSESTGRSGSLFFKTDDGQYYFKTLKSAEAETMKSILEDYYNYLLEEKRTFIMKMLGLYRIKYPFSQSTWILVFRSSFACDLPIHCTLDLKGRKPKPGKSFKERGRTSPYSAPIKDNELECGMLIKDPTQLQFYLEQTRRDAEFLKSHDLIDYSLLVGIHNVKGCINRPVCKCRNEFIGEDSNGNIAIYHFGIIDCLTQYTLKKRIANACKSILWEQSMLSTVNSHYYANRFVDFMTNRLLVKGKITY